MTGQRLHTKGKCRYIDKIGALAASEHRSMTNYIEYVLIKHLEQAEKERGVIDAKTIKEE